MPTEVASALGWPGLSGALHTALGFAVAYVLGAVIGFERQWRQRTAGLRTNVLVALGAAAFADLGLRLRGVEGGTQIIAYVVSGIGFLGAGVILKDGTNIRGLNTAATLWCSAAVGAFCGAGLAAEAIMLTVAIIAANTALRPLVNWVNRRPIAHDLTEAQYIVHVVCRPEAVSDVRDLLEEVLNTALYPPRTVELRTGGSGDVELDATLVPTSAHPGELDAVIVALERSPLVKIATWTVGTTA